MLFQLPFLKPSRVPMLGLLEHYAVVAKGMAVVEESLTGYLSHEKGKSLHVLLSEMDSLEGEADKIKRRVRNHLPPGSRMVVSKILFLDYTGRQDDILDFAQEAQGWLGVRPAAVPSSLCDDLMSLVLATTETVGLLKPALESVVGLVHRDHRDRAATKELIHDVRDQHLKAARLKFKIMSSALSDENVGFRDIYQILKYVECLHDMSHSAETCANILRAMIAE